MKKKHLFINSLYLILGVFFFIFIWWLVSISLENNSLHYLPSPFKVFSLFGIDLFGERAAIIYPAIGYTFLKLLVGFLISLFLAVLLGTFAALFTPFKMFLKSHILLFKSVPTAGIALMLGTIFWLEIPSLQPFTPSILVFLIAFPILYESILEGISSISVDQMDAIRMEGAERKFETVKEIYWPESKPYLDLGITNAFGLSLKVAVMSEIVTNSGTSYGKGLGTLIGNAIQDEANLEEALALSLIAVFLLAIVDIVRFIFKKVVVIEKQN